MVNKIWNIKNVPPETRRSIKAYAAYKGLTIAEALTKVFNEIEGEQTDGGN